LVPTRKVWCLPWPSDKASETFHPEVQCSSAWGRDAATEHIGTNNQPSLPEQSYWIAVKDLGNIALLRHVSSAAKLKADHGPFLDILASDAATQRTVAFVIKRQGHRYTEK